MFKKKWNVTVFSLNSPKRKRHLGKKVNYIKGDISKISDLKKIKKTLITSLILEDMLITQIKEKFIIRSLLAAKN